MSQLSVPIPEPRRLGFLQAFARQTREFLLRPPADQEAWLAARRFLEGQGFDAAHWDQVAIGFFPDCPTMRGSLQDAGFSAEEIDASELAADPRLAGRLVGPIRDIDGTIKSFWARHPQGCQPQYLFKGKWKEDLPVFGLDVAMPSLAAPDSFLVLTEGLFDVLLIQYLGFLNISAIGGSAVQMTRRRWQRLARVGVRRVVLVAGAEEARQHAVAVAVDNASRAKPAPEVLVLSPERLEGAASAGAFVRARGIEAFRALFAAPIHRPEPIRVVPTALNEPVVPKPPVEPPPRARRLGDGFCTLHGCEETDCFCFD